MKNIYVGNISFQTDEDSLRTAFTQFGTVDTVNIVRDRDSGQPRGFAFVEMSNDTEAEAAISTLDGRELKGRAIRVNEAQASLSNSHREQRISVGLHRLIMNLRQRTKHLERYARIRGPEIIRVAG